MAAALKREEAKQQFHEKKVERLQSMLDEARKQGKTFGAELRFRLSRSPLLLLPSPHSELWGNFVLRVVE